jgi:single-stranded-DNA-specific exonuclease
MQWTDHHPSKSSQSLPGFPPLVSQTLLRQGVDTPEKARAFLNPDEYQPSAPENLPGLPEALDRLIDAVVRKEHICVWGDFDVDGQTATTILFETLRNLGAEVTYHIPIREKESHGITVPVLAGIIDAGAKLILTCDTGITAFDALRYAQSKKVDVIVTDHHDLQETLPPATAIINPKLLPSGHPLASLAGAGVAYKLAEALYTTTALNRGGSPDDLYDLVALGLVADLALLRGDVRYLVQKGLVALRNTKRLGIKTMLELAQVRPANLNEEHIGFNLGPRLNALGRLGDANPAVDLFTTTDPSRARVLATQLEGLNSQRQLQCSQVRRAAEAQIQAEPSLLELPILILSHSTWPGGVIGIVAGNLVEKYGKPAILFTTSGGEIARGSARSIEGVNISALIAAQKELLLNFGGHPMAAGLSLLQENFVQFSRRLQKTAGLMLEQAQIGEPEIQIDAWLNLPDISLDLAGEIETLAPFGPGNEKLVFATHDLLIQKSISIGRNKEHVKLTVLDETGYEQSVLWWNGAGEEQPKGKFDLAYSVRSTDWQGTPQVQIEWVDFRSVRDQVLEITGEKPQVIDHRMAKEPRKLLMEITQKESCLIWADGVEKKKVSGIDRNGVALKDDLVIWSSPPSPEILRSVLEIVKPRSVYLFAVDAPQITKQDFLKHLLGLVKNVLNNYQGKITVSELAASTNQTNSAVRFGLELLESMGQCDIQFNKDGENLYISLDNPKKNESKSEQLNAKLDSILTETKAYIKYFRAAPAETLF